jgi:hypothetical protein
MDTCEKTASVFCPDCGRYFQLVLSPPGPRPKRQIKYPTRLEDPNGMEKQTMAHASIPDRSKDTHLATEMHAPA